MYMKCSEDHGNSKFIYTWYLSATQNNMNEIKLRAINNICIPCCKDFIVMCIFNGKSVPLVYCSLDVI